MSFFTVSHFSRVNSAGFGYPGTYPKTPGGFFRYTRLKKPDNKTQLKHNCIVFFNNMFHYVEVVKPISGTLLNIFRYSKVLRHCWFGSRKSIRPAINFNDEVLACLSVCSEVQMTCMPLPSHHLCFMKIQNVLSFWYWLPGLSWGKGC